METTIAYMKPKTVKEALKFLQKHGGNAKIIAGGTDLLNQIKKGAKTPAALVNLKDVEELRGIAVTGKTVTIGALTTLFEIQNSEILAEHFPVLPYTASLMASPQVRNVATVGGNLANAAPSADMAPPLLVLAAKVEIHGPPKKRLIPLADFFTGPGETVMTGENILTRIKIPLMPKGARCIYRVHTLREAMDISMVSVAAYIKGRRKVGKARVALGAVAPVPMLVPEAAEVLEGQPFIPERIIAAGVEAREACKPIDDVRASANYRRHIVEILTRRTLQEIADGATS
ncbi:MAG: xanthine dehydrogenase family protein subunit M [Planctomycetota bacterium]|nr:MAG: xanthine dehydrogenase family protein subunit M [Planctomycetota bacterium]